MGGAAAGGDGLSAAGAWANSVARGAGVLGTADGAGTVAVLAAGRAAFASVDSAGAAAPGGDSALQPCSEGAVTASSRAMSRRA